MGMSGSQTQVKLSRLNINGLTLFVRFAVVTVDERHLTMTSSSFESSSPMGVEAVTSTAVAAAAAAVSSPTGTAAVIATSYSPKLPQLQTTFSAEDDQVWIENTDFPLKHYTSILSVSLWYKL